MCTKGRGSLSLSIASSICLLCTGSWVCFSRVSILRKVWKRFKRLSSVNMWSYKFWKAHNYTLGTHLKTWSHLSRNLAVPFIFDWYLFALNRKFYVKTSNYFLCINLMTSTHKKENLKHFLKLSTLLILNLVCPVGKKKKMPLVIAWKFTSIFWCVLMCFKSRCLYPLSCCILHCQDVLSNFTIVP